MKTAMQEMILNIESIESKTTDQEQTYMLTALKIAALVLINKEKEQIIEAFDYRLSQPYGGFDDEYCHKGVEYYNKKYEKNI